MLPTILWNTLLLIPVLMVLVLPFVSALFSRRVSGMERIWWALASLFSWPGYFIYYYFRVRDRAPKA